MGMVGGVFSLDSGDRFAVLGLSIAGLFVLWAIVVWDRLPKTLVAAHLLGAGLLLSVALAVLTNSPALLVGLAAQTAVSAVLARMFKDWLLATFAAVLGAISLAWTIRSTVDATSRACDGTPAS